MAIDRLAGIGFSFIFMLLGWAFAPFDTDPVAAYWVSVGFGVVGLCGVAYFDFFARRRQP